jgi:molybdopterin-containing oxidoreductase family membrane subunit
VGVAVLVGMWVERYLLVAHSLTRGPLASSWGVFRPTPVDLSLLIGSLGWFLFLFLLFLRYVPAVAGSEVKKLVWEEAEP